VKQNVTVTLKHSSARICRSNHACAFGRRLSAQLNPVRSSGHAKVLEPPHGGVEAWIVEVEPEKP